MVKQLFLTLTFLLFFPVMVFSEITFNKTNDLVSIKSDGLYLSEILLQISEKAGVDVYIDPDADKLVYLDITDQPLDRTIQNMVRPLSVAIVYSGQGSRKKAGIG